MNLPEINILDEKNSILHKKSNEVSFPLSSEDKKLIKDMLKYLKMSQIDEYTEKYNLRPGMGLAFIQLGFTKRIFVLCIENEDNPGTFTNYIVINPKIISSSEEMIYVGEGEGCLSVNRPVEGIVPRHARLTVEAYDENGIKYITRVREDVAVAFQHEIDHLNGLLFTDKIDKKEPFKYKNKMREI